jgi:hypothetical protein
VKKIAQSVAKTTFCQNYNIAYNVHSKKCPENLGYFCNFKKLAERTIIQRRKFAQSGHPSPEISKTPVLRRQLYNIVASRVFHSIIGG